MGPINRTIIPGCLHHVTQRGVRRMQTFHCEEDYEEYLALLKLYSSVEGVKVYAYCLMPNHVHLGLVPTGLLSISRMLCQLHSLYARYLNSREGYSGHLWQQRFYSGVIASEYEAAVIRYIELNPVRAKLCEKPEAYSWSSARERLDNFSSGMLDDITLSKHPAKLVYSSSLEYREVEREDFIRVQTNKNLPVGGKKYLSELEVLSGRPSLPRAPGRPKKNSSL